MSECLCHVYSICILSIWSQMGLMTMVKMMNWLQTSGTISSEWPGWSTLQSGVMLEILSEQLSGIIQKWEFFWRVAAPCQVVSKFQNHSKDWHLAASAAKNRWRPGLDNPELGGFSEERSNFPFLGIFFKLDSKILPNLTSNPTHTLLLF